MKKTIEAVGEVIRSQEHPFRKAEHHSDKSLKNRHERHKIKEYINQCDWRAEEIELAPG